MKRLRSLLLATVLSSGLVAVAGAAPALADCTTKDGDAKVQLWDGLNCTGTSVAVRFNSGDDDRPNFDQFEDGGTKHVNNNQGSIAVHKGWCARVFQDVNYGGENTLFCASSATLFHSFGDTLNNRASAMRVCPYADQPKCNAVLDTPPPPTTTTTGTTPTETPLPPDPTDPTLPGDGTGTGDPTFPGGDPTSDFPPTSDGPAELGPEDGLRFDQAGRKCSKGSTAGAKALRDWVVSIGTLVRRKPDMYKCAKLRKGHRDTHSEGRAIDVQIQSQDAAEKLIATLLDDNYNVARRMGIQEIIYDGTYWSAASPSKLMRRYKGRSPHRRSVHLGLNRKGAAMKTSFWTGGGDAPASTSTVPADGEGTPPPTGPTESPGPVNDPGVVG